MRRAAVLFLAPLLLAPVDGSAAAQPRIVTLEPSGQGAEAMVLAEEVALRGLDTLNGRTEDIALSLGETAAFGHLEITVDACRVPEADPDGDAQAFLRIRDVREDRPRFSGWMFASSPALSALDHPRYDVWLVSCSMR
ncbi:hypothetical protein BH23PSE1_BH23PSE1_08830 [soil metagenome]